MLESAIEHIENSVRMSKPDPGRATGQADLEISLGDQKPRIVPCQHVFNPETGEIAPFWISFRRGKLCRVKNTDVVKALAAEGDCVESVALDCPVNPSQTRIYP